MQGAPERLRCEYLDSPLGIDVVRPRLSWCPGDTRPAELQTAYQILAASHPDVLDLDEGDFWDTGRVEGRNTHQIDYDGKLLTSGRSIWWKVRSFDSDGLPGPWSETATFEAGLLSADDWEGRWISAGMEGSRTDVVPVPVIGRRFELAGPPKSARLYVAALGQTEVQVNGTTLEGTEYSPDWIDFNRRAGYKTFDVTDLLVEGDNSLAALLADGHYAGRLGAGYRQQYGSKPWLNVQLNVVLGNGRTFSLSSDSGWRWQPSWILGADPTVGESVDGRRHRSNWLGDGPDSFGWYPVDLGDHARDQSLEMTAMVRASSRTILEPLESRWDESTCTLLLEFPRSQIGCVRLEVVAPAGGVVTTGHGFDLDAEGRLIATGSDTYTAAGGEAVERFEPTFSRHGFRFVEVTGDVFREEAVSAQGMSVSRELGLAATLISDHPVLNDLHEAMTEHLAVVQQGVPFNGLLPDDRLGAVAAFGGAANALLTNFDSAIVVTDWLRNMADAQFPEGGFPMAVPAPPGDELLAGEGQAGSSDAFVEVLWQLYRHCGDRRLLRHYFPAVKQLLAGAAEDSHQFVRENLESTADYPSDLAGTAWLYRSARLAARIAGVLGNLSDLEDCEELATNVRNAFRRRFVTPDGRVIGDSVAAYGLVLGVGLLDPTEQACARQSLFEACEKVLVGGGDSLRLLTTPFLLRVLTDHGRLDLAYRVALESRFQPNEAAGGTDVTALIAAGVDDWLINTLAGFTPGRDLSERQNAFRHMVIRPRPPLGIGFDEKPPG
jgi:alpha-L-rhamnosidase